MNGPFSEPGTQQRFAAYLDCLAQAAEHADRVGPIQSYCKGLLLPGERKSVEPMAARLAPDNVRGMHQSLHHVVAHAAWSDESLLEQVRLAVLPAMQRNGPVTAWIVEETGFPKKGAHSVGVAHQFCGQLGKEENCRVAISLSVATEQASLPIAWRLYLPKIWAQDRERREKTGVPEEISFETKPVMALGQIRKALADGVTAAPVLADAAFGDDTRFREGITALSLAYVVGVRDRTSVWRSDEAPLPAKLRKSKGHPLKLLRRDENRQPVSVKKVALGLPSEDWRIISWRQGTKQKLHSRFAVLRVRPAHRDYLRSELRAEEWLLIEWPTNEREPTQYWLATLPADTQRRELVKLAKLRWITERDYQELKQELGLGHYEGRGWRGFHHHATLCIAAYGFLVGETSRFPPSYHIGRLDLRAPEVPPQFRPRGSPRARRAS